MCSVDHVDVEIGGGGPNLMAVGDYWSYADFIEGNFDFLLELAVSSNQRIDFSEGRVCKSGSFFDCRSPGKSVI